MLTNRSLQAILAVIALLAIAVPALLVYLAPPAPAGRLVALPQRIVPPAEIPPVEPMRFVALAPDDARAFNASVPFADGPNPAARTFRFAGSDADRDRATDCLAAAVLYEAGDDAVGEKAVAQVVLNRLRHPAFPKSVCGVVFEGSTRSTGCQFTFTCDGALATRRPAAAGWARAQAVAAQALGGAVYRPVGYATHYHTDWVVPYWQSSLDKIAKVGTHLFFRWTGWWGTPPAFGRRPSGEEPVIAALFSLTGETPPETTADVTALPPVPPGGIAPVAGDADSFLATLPTDLAPELWPQLAARACADRPQCRFSAWTDRAKTPAALPLQPQQIATMSFAYLRDRPAGLERTLWNCRQTPRFDRTHCMKVQAFLPPPAPLASPAPLATPTPPRGPTELEGIRRRPAPPPEKPVLQSDR